jgi:hypothetical protein
VERSRTSFVVLLPDLEYRDSFIRLAQNYIWVMLPSISQLVHEVATAATNKAARKQKDNYDNKVRGGTVQVGDRVLVKVVSFEGKHKLTDRWEPLAL